MRVFGVALLLPLLLLPACAGEPDCADAVGHDSSDGCTGPPATGTTGADTDTGTDTGPAAETFGPGPWDHGVALEPEPQLPGDPAAGYEALLTRGYVSCGIPSGFFDLARPYLGDFASGDPLPGRPGKNAAVPYNWTVHSETESGEEIAAMNCLTCHAGQANGELLIGLGKADGDFTQNMGQLAGSLPVPDLPGFSELKNSRSATRP